MRFIPGTARRLAVLTLAFPLACSATPPATVVDVTPSKAAAHVASPSGAPHVFTAGAMPGNVDFYLEVGLPHGRLDAISPELGATTQRELRDATARALGVTPEAAASVLEDLESVHFGTRRVDRKFELTTSVVFRTGQPLRELFSRGAFAEVTKAPTGEQRMKLKDSNSVAWFDADKLLVIAKEEQALDHVAAVLSGSEQGLSEAKRGASIPLGGMGARAFVSPALLDFIAEGQASFADPLTVAYDRVEQGIRGAYKVGLAPKNKAALAPSPRRPLTLARSLPRETIGYVAASTGLTDGLSSLDPIVALAGSPARQWRNGVLELQGIVASVGGQLPELVHALGDEGVLGVIFPRGPLSAEPATQVGVVWLQDVQDPKPFEQLFQVLRNRIAAVPNFAKLHSEPSGFSVDVVPGTIKHAEVRLARGKLFVGVGEREIVRRALLAFETGKGTLGDDPAHAQALSALPGASQLRLWIDAAALSEIASSLPGAKRGVLGATPALAQGPGRVTSAFALSIGDAGGRANLELDEINGLGAFAPIAVFGVRRYLAAAKTAEAKNILGVIARGAGVSYERERVDPNNPNIVTRELCKSAKSVPDVVPRATKHTPSESDWTSGDELTGWRCLRFEMSTPHYYRYSYVAGGPYKGPARGGPDPGPNGFEASAEGDLDGDGVTSLFTITGKIDPATKQLVISPIFSDRELE